MHSEVTKLLHSQKESVISYVVCAHSGQKRSIAWRVAVNTRSLEKDDVMLPLYTVTEILHQAV